MCGDAVDDGTPDVHPRTTATVTGWGFLGFGLRLVRFHAPGALHIPYQPLNPRHSSVDTLTGATIYNFLLQFLGIHRLSTLSTDMAIHLTSNKGKLTQLVAPGISQGGNSL